MKTISLAAAITLLNQSERTLRRRIAEGVLPKVVDEGGSNRTLLPFDVVLAQACIPLDPEDMRLLEHADSGNMQAQSDLGLLFLAHGQHEGALYWLEQSAKQGCSEAMHWLGRCHAEGVGMKRDEDLGMMWLANAAAHGHIISKAQMQAFREKITGG
jgi:hypothetical protein